jgi:hypothetical protein
MIIESAMNTVVHKKRYRVILENVLLKAKTNPRDCSEKANRHETANNAKDSINIEGFTFTFISRINEFR